MKVFHCDHCGHLLFFENTQCLSCGHRVAYLPDLELVGSLEPDAADPTRWSSPLQRAGGRTYRLCRNYTEYDVCNWAIDMSDEHLLCISCRLTHVVPDVAQPDVRRAWYRLETAKRRLVYTLLNLRLPLDGKDTNPTGSLAFEFRMEGEGPSPVLTGHANGVITINMAEADDAERERRRTALHEPYRTLLGHMRHESGHHYWDRLIRDSAIDRFRAIFGDERQDYQQALKKHYDQGPLGDWPLRFVTAYASSHPWEDWAETWAHYLHMIDTLEMAAACGLSLEPRRAGEPVVADLPPPDLSANLDFDRLIENWFAVTYLLNNLNRGLGMADAYPFVLPGPAVDKLRFVHEDVSQASHQHTPVAS
jgi:hypothetical protein